MFHNYFKIALRNLRKHKGTSFINIFGLAVGMTCAILIFMWVQNQLSYNQWQENKDNIYRLESESWVVMAPFLRETVNVFPEVKEAVRFYFWSEPTLKYREKVFTVDNFAFVDSNIFKVFNFEFIAGDPQQALNAPNSIVLTESVSGKLFGSENPVGKMIQMYNRYDYTITGVVKDIDKLHMDINGFASVTDITRRQGENDFLTSRSNNFDIYLLTVPGIDIDALVEKINTRASEVDEYRGDRLILRPYNDIYFANNLQHEKNTKHASMNLIIVFSIIAILILSIACINFVNLTVARMSTREKEIAVRKVAGAGRGAIQKQFFSETFFTVFISFVISAILVFILMPEFSNLTGELINFGSLNAGFYIILAGIVLFTALLSGFYPSFYLSVLEPVIVLKGKSGKGRKNSTMSKVLISFQFAISIFLIISALTVVNQLSYMQNKELGIDHEKIITCMLRGDKFRGDAEKQINSKKAFEARLKTSNLITGATFVTQLPGKVTNTWSWYVTDPESRMPIKVINSDPNFIDIMNIELLEGRNFSYDFPADRGKVFLINEEAARQLELTDPLTTPLNNNSITVVGVVKDFHINSLHNAIEPVAIAWRSWPSRACIKITGTDIRGAIRHIESVFNEFCPGFAFEYDFLDESFARQYKAEQQLEKILFYFVGIAICLSFLGLFALTAFIAERKTKEIGIRKVLGSSDKDIVLLLSKSFILWILAANLVSWPIAYWVLQNWLEGFAYRIEINFILFFAGGFLTLAVAVLTIGYQALKAANKNPVISLKYE